MPIVRAIRCFEGDTVEIQWKLKTGETYYQRVTVPPKATRDAKPSTESEAQRLAAKGQTSLDVVGTTGGKASVESRTVEDVLSPAARQEIDDSRDKPKGT